MAGVLTDRAVIAVSGSEAKSFLQGLITNDIGRLGPDMPLYAALLTPQGKVLFDFFLSEQDNIVFIDCWATSAHAFLKRLTIYRLRAKVELSLRNDLGVLWNGIGGPDPRVPELGTRGIASTTASDAFSEYLSHRLALGVPEGADFSSDKIFALDAGLEELHGVSFDKGCYIGQELTARMKHRGTARKRLLPIETSSKSPLPPPGTTIRAGETTLGEITSTYGQRGFGLVRLDRWHETDSTTPQAGERAVRIVRPAWLADAETS